MDASMNNKSFYSDSLSLSGSGSSETLPDLFCKDNRNNNKNKNTHEGNKNKILNRNDVDVYINKIIGKYNLNVNNFVMYINDSINLGYVYKYIYINLRKKKIFCVNKQELSKKYKCVNKKFLKTYNYNNTLFIVDSLNFFEPQYFPSIESVFGCNDFSSALKKIITMIKGAVTGVKNIPSVVNRLLRIDWNTVAEIVTSVYFSSQTCFYGGHGVLQFLFHICRFIKYFFSLGLTKIEDEVEEEFSDAERASGSDDQGEERREEFHEDEDFHEDVEELDDETSQHDYFSGDESDFVAQSYTLESLLAGFAIFGVPSGLISKCRDFVLLTGVKISASHSFSLFFCRLRDIIMGFLDFFLKWKCFSYFSDFLKPVKDLISYIFSPFEHYDNILKVVEYYTEFIQHPSRIHDPIFRTNVSSLYDTLKSDPNYLDYINNHSNKNFVITWRAFKENLVKFVETYTDSEREEPICIVFDGPPGSGKSVLMNKFVEYLKTTNHSVYTHTVPPVDTSKDFYDDYMNQDVFVMDDVGQQGKSQWRTIINFVSPVKYPLDCAQAEKKNTKFFQSKIILCTTNNFRHLSGFVAKDGIATPDALFRRVHLIQVKKVAHLEMFKQSLTYLKYDECSRSWVNSFLNSDSIDTKFTKRSDGKRLALSMVSKVDSIKEGITFCAMLLNHLLEAKERDRVNLAQASTMYTDIANDIENNSDQIISSISGYEPQFGSFYELGIASWRNLMHGMDMFKGFINDFTHRMDQLRETLWHKILLDILFPTIDKIVALSENPTLIAFGAMARGLYESFFYDKTETHIVYNDRFQCHLCQKGFELSEFIFKNPCGHTLCGECKDDLRLYSTNDICKCPVCRKSFNMDDIEGGQAYYGYNDNMEAVCFIQRKVATNAINELILCVGKKMEYLVSKISRFNRAVQRSISFVALFEIAQFISILTFGTLMCRVFSKAFKGQAKEGGWFDWLFGRSNICKVTSDNFNKAKKEMDEKISNIKIELNAAQSTKQKHCRLMVDTKTGTHTCIFVSGCRLITNSHVNPDGMIVDIYQSIQHYENKHKEMESVKVKVIKNYIKEDICVCELCDVVPLYKTFKLFGAHMDVTTKFSPSSFVSPYGIIPLLPTINFSKNKNSISYKYKSNGNNVYVEADQDSGFLYNIQGAGLCGSVILTSNNQIVGMHSTGNGKEGFAKCFPEWLCTELTQLMTSGRQLKNSFEISDKIQPELSGVRMRYEKEDKWNNYVFCKSTIVPSEFHVGQNEDVRKLYDQVHELQVAKEICNVDLTLKSPANFGSSSMESKEKIKELSKKSLLHQGYVDNEELEFVHEFVGLMIPDKFTDITEMETAFGGENVRAFNKDSSNGFGCLPHKNDYLDFDNRIIKDECREVISRLKENAEQNLFDEDDFVCKETMKEELRKPEKVDEPRTFRVMPFPHIWWTKRIFGELIPYYKKHLHDFGICVGLNPYLDFDKMVLALLQHTTHGDADFGKWDGRLLALLMLEIGKIFKERYVGDFVEIMDYLLVTMCRSWTLVSDELYATTHGLPSGTWLTLLMNCLVNKALMALTIHRKNPALSAKEILEKVSDYVCGDDKWFGSSLKEYNLLTIKEVATSLGMVVTNGDKSEIKSPGQSFEKLNFVKRSIVFHPVLKRYVGALSVDTLINTIQWYNCKSKYVTYEELMQSKANAVLIEAYLHSVNCYKLFFQLFDKHKIINLFSEDKVKSILNDSSGYDYTLNLLEKDFNY